MEKGGGEDVPGVGKSFGQEGGGVKLELQYELFRQILPADARSKDTPWPRDIIDSMLREGKLESEDEAHKILYKWSQDGLYDYGVTLDLGWLTDMGMVRQKNSHFDMPLPIKRSGPGCSVAELIAVLTKLNPNDRLACGTVQAPYSPSELVYYGSIAEGKPPGKIHYPLFVLR